MIDVHALYLSGFVLHALPIPFMVTSLALMQSYGYQDASEIRPRKINYKNAIRTDNLAGLMQHCRKSIANALVTTPLH